jgi:hypothetical protein
VNVNVCLKTVNELISNKINCRNTFRFYVLPEPFPVAARSKAWVFGHSHSGIAGLNPGGVGGHGCISVVSVVCCQVEVSATS